MMEPTKPIFWYQGLFLQPQHFQQNDLYTHSLLFPLQTFIQPYFWGICRLRIQESSLSNQVLEILEISIIFRDGTWVSYPGNAMLQSRSFKGSWTESEKPLKVYLGLRRWDPSQHNVTILTGDNEKASTRYVCLANPENIKDLHQAGSEAQIKYLYHALKIFWENEIVDAGDYDLLPIAQLEFDGHNTILSRLFAPPLVTMAGSDNVMVIVKNIRDQVTSRCRFLEEYKHPHGIQIQEGDVNTLKYILALRSLNRYVPLLHQITETTHIHPWNAYSLIRALIGELSTFTDRINSLGKLKDGTDLLPAYNHENLGNCFAEAETLIYELLNQIMIGAENVIYFKREGDYFTAQIPIEAFDSRNSFHLVLKTDRVNEALIQHMVKVSSSEKMPVLVKRALPGMSLELMSVLPPGLPRRTDALYFKLDHTSTEWADIQKNANICLYWNAAPEDTSAEVIIIRK